ncbi:CRP-like cAMP-binding protein [Chryseobacterium ginsenosidimutans]|jgi:CRP-like cAMP-binding protein|uniref:Crp/Fnr family transcriptional regulator n=1 Tax=Chryseobacterium ginsenosidimutans TaxID=687846 RepID=UPI00216A7C1C|nr:Crp/Fnr family transcriptional regulator [Chryseobacterium ginsenosidimutans]MCS3869283.1 CRP-like cAMP-binding protein [Chryseobacterium ginsenosidimutans]
MDVLRNHIEEITPLNDGEFDYIQSFFTLKKVRKNQFLISEGDDVRSEYLVLSGIYKVFYLDEEGKEYICMFALKNWWMSDYKSYFNQIPATMYLECIAEGEVLCLSLLGREKIAADMHKMEHFFRVKLTHGFVALQQRIKLLLSNTPQQRYEQFAKLYPDLLQHVPKKCIAEFIGVSRETLSRLHPREK